MSRVSDYGMLVASALAQVAKNAAYFQIDALKQTGSARANVSHHIPRGRQHSLICLIGGVNEIRANDW